MKIESASVHENLSNDNVRLRAENDILRSMLVYEFNGDVVPMFSTIPHEISDLVTPERCKWFVDEIERLRSDNERLRVELSTMNHEAVAYLDANYGFMRCGNLADNLPIGTKLYPHPPADCDT